MTVSQTYKTNSLPSAFALSAFCCPVHSFTCSHIHSYNGERSYEITDHLGSITNVLSDADNAEKSNKRVRISGQKLKTNEIEGI